MNAGRDVLALTKPRLTLANVTAAATGLLLAPGAVRPGTATAALAGVTLLIASANALNMYLERDLDAVMACTRGRPLPAGRIAPGVALGVGLLLPLLGVPLLALGTTPLAAALGTAAHGLYVLGYTPLKRRTPHALFAGTIPGALPPLIGWTAAGGAMTPAAFALFGWMIVWQLPHSLAIQLVRSEDYARAELRVLPAVHGERLTKLVILAALGLQLMASLAVAATGLGGAAYRAGALLLGVGMLGWGALGLRLPTAGTTRWARWLFILSIGYLPVMLGLLLLG